MARATWFLLLMGTVIPAPAPAQCVPLDANPNPLAGGCFSALAIACNRPPQVGNAGFEIVRPFPCGGLCTGGPWLAVGPCATSPLVLPPSGPCVGSQNCVCALSPGCSIYLDYFAFYVVLSPVVAGSTYVWSLPIPNDPTLVGASLCAHGITYTLAPVTAHCFDISDGLSITVF